eukprot:422334_1
MTSLPVTGRSMVATVTGATFVNAHEFPKGKGNNEESSNLQLSEKIKQNEKAMTESISNVTNVNSPTINSNIINTDDMDVSEKMQHKLSHQITAYASFELMSSLMFGFSVSILFSTPYETKFGNYFASEIIFLLLMSSVLLSNLITMIVMSLSSYFVNRYIADLKYESAHAYLHIYRYLRKIARHSFYFGLACFIA